MANARTNLAFLLGGVAVVLRMLSDWLFASGGPLPYQLAQAFFLVLALLALGPRTDLVFLKGGENRAAMQRGLMAAPIALLGGVALAFVRFDGPQWPTLAEAAPVIANNLFFPVVEELEFRGFFLGWLLLQRRISPPLAVWSAAILHTLAHSHLLWQGNYLMAGITLLLFVWYGWLTVGTRSLWGAFVAHSVVNIFGFLPTVGAGRDIMRS